MNEDSLGEGIVLRVWEGLVDFVGVSLRVTVLERVPDPDPVKEAVELADSSALPEVDKVEVEVNVAGLVEGRELGDTVEVAQMVTLVERQEEGEGELDTEGEGVRVSQAVREGETDKVGEALPEMQLVEESVALGYGVEVGEEASDAEVISLGDGELDREGMWVELVLTDTMEDTDPNNEGERVLDTLLLPQLVGESDAGSDTEGDTEGDNDKVGVCESQGVGEKEGVREVQLVVVGVSESVPVAQVVEDALKVWDNDTVALALNVL